MWQFLSANWIWFLLIGAMLWMHLGHGRHGGQGGCGGGHQHSGTGSTSAQGRSGEDQQHRT